LTKIWQIKNVKKLWCSLSDRQNAARSHAQTTKNGVGRAKTFVQVTFCIFAFYFTRNYHLLLLLSINQSIKTHLYSAICRERIRGATVPKILQKNHFRKCFGCAVIEKGKPRTSTEHVCVFTCYHGLKLFAADASLSHVNRKTIQTVLRPRICSRKTPASVSPQHGCIYTGRPEKVSSLSTTSI